VGAARLSIALFVLAFAALFVPLAYVHAVDPAIAHRWEMTRLWDAGASPFQIAALVAMRYLQHFSLDFLFARGDPFIVVNPLRAGAFPWVVLPFMAAGVWAVAARWRTSAAARTLGVMVLAYPAGDLVSRYAGVHSARSAPGIGALVLLAAYGALALWNVLGARIGRWRSAVAIAVALVALLAHARFVLHYFRDFDRDPAIDLAFDTDLRAATSWLKPRLEQYDAVFWTTRGTNEPFATTLVGLGYDPRRWFAEPRDTRVLGGWEVTARYGKMWFMYDDAWRGELERLGAGGRIGRVLFIVRPGELDLSAAADTIRNRDGTPALMLYERTVASR
jgi:hypothetical protein